MNESGISLASLCGWWHHSADPFWSALRQETVLALCPGLWCVISGWVISRVMLGLSLVAPQPDCNVWGFYLYDRRAAVSMFRGRRVDESGRETGRNSVGWAGLEQGGWFVWGGLLIIRVLLCVQMYFLIPTFPCFCLFSSWIIPVSGLQHIFHLLHSKYTKRQE